MPLAATQGFIRHCCPLKNGVYTLVVKITTQCGEGHGPESWEVLKGLLLVYGGDQDNWSHSNKPRRKEGCCGVTGRNTSCHCLATWGGLKIKIGGTWRLQLDPDPHRESVSAVFGDVEKWPTTFQSCDYRMQRSETQGERLINPNDAPTVSRRVSQSEGPSQQCLIEQRTIPYKTLRTNHRALKGLFQNCWTEVESQVLKASWTITLFP